MTEVGAASSAWGLQGCWEQTPGLRAAAEPTSPRARSPYSHERVVGELLRDGGWHRGLPDAVLLLRTTQLTLTQKLRKVTFLSTFSRSSNTVQLRGQSESWLSVRTGSLLLCGPRVPWPPPPASCPSSPRHHGGEGGMPNFLSIGSPCFTV